MPARREDSPLLGRPSPRPDERRPLSARAGSDTPPVPARAHATPRTHHGGAKIPLSSTSRPPATTVDGAGHANVHERSVKRPGFTGCGTDVQASLAGSSLPPSNKNKTLSADEGSGKPKRHPASTDRAAAASHKYAADRWAFCPRPRSKDGSRTSPQQLKHNPAQQPPKTGQDKCSESSAAGNRTGHTTPLSSIATGTAAAAAAAVAAATAAAASAISVVQHHDSGRASLSSPRGSRGRVQPVRNTAVSSEWPLPSSSVRRSQTPPNVCLMGGLRSTYGIHTRANLVSARAQEVGISPSPDCVTDQLECSLSGETQAQTTESCSQAETRKPSEAVGPNIERSANVHSQAFRAAATNANAVVCTTEQLPVANDFSVDLQTPHVTQLWSENQTMRQERTTLFEILQRTCRQCGVNPIASRGEEGQAIVQECAADLSDFSEFRQLLEALCFAHAALAPRCLKVDIQNDTVKLPRRQLSAPPGRMFKCETGHSDDVDDAGSLVLQVAQLKAKLSDFEVRELKLQADIETLRASEASLQVEVANLRSSRASDEHGAPERAPEPILHAQADSVFLSDSVHSKLAASKDDQSTIHCSMGSSKDLLVSSPFSSMSSLLPAAGNLAELLEAKHVEISELQTSSNAAEAGSEEWLQATTLLAAAREELRLLKEFAGPSEVGPAQEPESHEAISNQFGSSPRASASFALR